MANLKITHEIGFFGFGAGDSTQSLAQVKHPLALLTGAIHSAPINEKPYGIFSPPLKDYFLVLVFLAAVTKYLRQTREEGFILTHGFRGFYP
jgi:hypothetical protein